MALSTRKISSDCLKLGEIGRRDAFGISAAIARTPSQDWTQDRLARTPARNREPQRLFWRSACVEGCSITQIQDVDNKFARTCEMGKS